MTETVYPCLAADPPWQYGDQLNATGKIKRGADRHYPTMTVTEICHLSSDARTMSADAKSGRLIPTVLQPLTIAGHRVADTALLWLWVTNPFLLDGSGARVCRAWGFKPKQLVTWVKGRIAICYPDDDGGIYRGGELVLNIGMGHYTRGCTEHLIVGTRGKAMSLITNKGIPNVVLASRGRHSAKPQAAYDLIERAQGDGPRLELFARGVRLGWDVWGNEV